MFTVITPSFNQSVFIQATLDSVRAQSVQDIEHLIYDPGSTDGSVGLIQAYCAAYDRAEFILGQDKSQTNAINLGFSRARGDILCWLNSDDTFFDDQVLEEVQRQFRTYPDTDILYGRGQFISPNGEVLNEAFINRDHRNIRALMANSLGILQPSLFMRQRVFEEAGPLDESMNFSFDYEYWARCARRGMTFRFFDRQLSRAVIHEDAKTMRARSISLDESLKVGRRHYGFVSQDWVERKADYVVNGSDGILNVKTEAGDLGQVSRDIFRQENTTGRALSAYFNRDPMMNKASQDAFGYLVSELFPRAYLSGWDKNYFDMGVTLVASIYRLDPEAHIFVFDVGMTAEQRAFLRQLDKVILLDSGFAPYRHDWQKTPKNYVFKIVVFNHLLSLLPADCQLLWIDAGVMLLQNPDKIFQKIARKDVFFVDHDDSRHWPLFNASFTSDQAILAGGFSPAELAGPHVCACLFGCRVGSPAQKIFAEAARLAEVFEVAVADKHPPDSEKRTAQDKTEQSAQVVRLASDRAPARDMEPLRKIFGYYGHRQDQSIISILAARHGLPISSAKVFCPATDQSSQISKENWFEGISASLGGFASVPDDQPGMTFHHRGLVKDFHGLRFAFDRQPVAGILGNGPSLADIDLPALRGTDCFGMNAAYRYWHQTGWYPQYYSCLDTVVGMSHKDAIRDLIRNRDMYGIKAFLLRNNLVQWLAETGDLDGVIDFDLIRFGVREFLPDPITTGSHTLGWAVFTGYRLGFVAGVDCNYVETVDGAEKKPDGTLLISEQHENPNYFFSEYQQVGDQYNVPNPSLDLHIRSWRNVAAELPKQICIRNVSLASRMDAFPQVTFADAFVDFRLHDPARLEPAARGVACPQIPAAQSAPEGNAAQTNGADIPLAQTSVQDARQALDRTDGRLCLTFDDPVAVVSETLAKHGNTTQVLTQWCEEMGELLVFYRQNRARLELVEHESLQRYPEAYRAALSNRAVTLPETLPDPVASVARPLEEALARTIVTIDDASRQILEELQASAVWPLDVSPETAPDPPAIAQAHDQDRAFAADAAQVEEIRAALEHKTEVVRHLTAQIKQMRAITESYFREVEQVRQKLQDHRTAEEDLQDLREEVGRIYRSKSWRITEPMRGLRRFFSRAEKKRDVDT